MLGGNSSRGAGAGVGAGVGGAPALDGLHPTTANISTQSSTDNATTMPCDNLYYGDCLTNEEYVDLVREYIFPTVFEWCLIVLYAVVFIFGLIGNFLVVFVVLRNDHMRTITNLFLVNLSVADFLVLLVCLPTSVLTDVTETWFLGSVMCRLVTYLQAVSVSVSVLTLTVISMERYYAICHPLSFKSTRMRARVMIILVWTLSLLIIVPELVVLDTFRHKPFMELLTVCKPSWSYSSQAVFQIVLIVALFFLPLCLMAFAYIRIALCLWKDVIPTETCRYSQGDKSLMAKGNSEVRQQIQSRRNVAKMLIAVVVMFTCCYLPVHMLNILRYAGVLAGLGQGAIHFALIGHWLCYFNSAINPVIYNFMSGNFRKEFIRACSCCLRLCFPQLTRRHVRGYRAGTYGYHYGYSNSAVTHADHVTQTEHIMLDNVANNRHLEELYD